MSNFQTKARSEPKQPEVWNFAEDEGTKILAFSGKLGSGKTSATNYLHSLAFMYSLGLTNEAFVNEAGKLVVADSNGDFHEANLDSKDPEVTSFLAEQVWPFIKKYSCADPLKQICIDVLGLDENLVYGSQEDKNTVTHLKWEDMPSKLVCKNKTNKKSSIAEQIDEPELKSGYMTIREVLEYVGTEIFRRIDNNCWAKALVKTIKRDKSAFAIIDDVRFSNELFAVQQAGGKVVRLTLTTDESKLNTHISNTALDGHEDKFDAVIDNQNLSMEDSFRELIMLLMKWGWFKVVNQ